MALVRMVRTDEDALVCDFAAEYGILDWRALPRMTAATLAVGLSADSRIKRRLAGAALTTQTALLAILADRLGTLCWLWSKDGADGRNQPESLLQALLGGNTERPGFGYASGAEFEAARAAILEKVKNNGD